MWKVEGPLLAWYLELVAFQWVQGFWQVMKPRELTVINVMCLERKTEGEVPVGQVFKIRYVGQSGLVNITDGVLSIKITWTLRTVRLQMTTRFTKKLSRKANVDGRVTAYARCVVGLVKEVDRCRNHRSSQT